MPRSVKAVKKRGKKFRPNLKNRAAAVKRAEKKKKLSHSDVSAIKEAWDTGRTPRENLKTMGLAFNPNEVVPIKQPHRKYIDTMPIASDPAPAPSDESEPAKPTKPSGESKRYQKKKNEKAELVLPALESGAKEGYEKIKNQQRKRHMLDRDVELCIYLIERHGDDYQAMSRDVKNLWQDTPKQLAKKIRMFKESPMYKVLVDV